MMKQDNYHRLICSEDKKSKIRMTKKNTQLRHSNMVVKCYECKIVERKLNKKQHEELDMLFVEGKWFYNHVLNMKKNGIHLRSINTTHIKTVKHFDKDKNPIESELRYLSSQQKQALVQRMISNEKTIRSLVKNKFQDHGSLQFKSELNCIPLKQYGNSYVFKSANKVRISGISGKIRVKTGGQLDNVDELANANLIHRPDGYYLIVTCYIDKSKIEQTKRNGKEIGLDFGIHTNITTSEGEKLDVSVEESEHLKKLQAKLENQKKGSNRRYKTIKKIRRQYQKMTNRKIDKANKIVHKLKQYDIIVMQDEQLSEWHKKKGMSKIVQHSCMGLIKSKLMKLDNVIILDKYIPTTKWCPKCGKKHSIGLDERTYVCECGYQEDRDVHSAKNMLNIKNLVFSKLNLVPTEHREVKREEFCEAER